MITCDFIGYLGCFVMTSALVIAFGLFIIPWNIVYIIKDEDFSKGVKCAFLTICFGMYGSVLLVASVAYHFLNKIIGLI